MRLAKLSLFSRVQVLFVLVLLFGLLPMAPALADPNFTTAGFQTKWQRADKPVGDGVVSRSWLWGPQAFSPASGSTEPYADSPGGNRQVLYFDKARMELNNAANGLVTNGLLVRELISGREATSDTAFLQRRAADDIPVAGDPANNTGPTYASFSKLVSLNNDNPATARLNAPVTDSLDQSGTVSTASADLSSKAKYVYFDSNLKHNIPDVFWNFMNQQGTIYQNGQFVTNQPVLGDNPAAPWLDAMGLPISEAYWAKVTLAGQTTDVLIQAFERRVLTFTPSNPAAFQVEMGNVGRHYFSWRYDPKYDLNGPTVTTVTSTPTTTSTPSATITATSTATPTDTVTPTPTPPVSTVDCSTAKIDSNTNGAYTYPRCGPAGMEIVLGFNSQPGETITINPTAPDGTTRPSFDATANDKGVINELYKTAPSTINGEWIFKFHSVTSNKDGVAYVVVAPPVSKPAVIAYPNPVSVNAVIAFIAVGFNPGELVTVQVKGPNGVSSTPVQVPVSDNGGGVTLVFQPLFSPGQWVFTATAVSDNTRNATVNFTVTS